MPARANAPAVGTTVTAVLSQATARLQDCTGAPRLEAETLLAHLLGGARAELYTHPEHRLSPRQLDAYARLLERRARGVPLPYLTGHIEFYALDIAIDRRVLIPRPETETLIDLAVAQLADFSARRYTGLVLADVGTGSGCIAIALAVHAPDAHIFALDISPATLDVARANAEHHNVTERITCIQSDLLTDLPRPVDLMLANPPYIAAAEWPALPREVRQYEPHLALHGGSEGLEVIRRLLNTAPHHLRPGGAMFIEIGASQGPAVTDLAHQAFPGADIAIQADLAGLDRVLCIRSQPATARPKSGR